MSRVACSLVLLAVIAGSLRAADLPPGAIVRLGDDRFRAGGGVHHLALSPDGKQFATARYGGRGLTALTVWDSATGRPVRERRVNSELFRGLVWGEGGAFTITLRADPGKKGKPAKLVPDDFRVWDFTDSKAASPPVLPGVYDGLPDELGKRRRDDPGYHDFVFSADGRRVAARWLSADNKHAIHVFELKPADTVAKLTRVGVIDLGAEGADGVRLSANGKTLVTFRALASPDDRGEWTATAWDVAKGQPGRPVRVSGFGFPPPLTPDGGDVVISAGTEKEWGYDLIELGTGKRSKLGRTPHADGKDAGEPQVVRDEDQPADYVFLPSGRALVVPGYRTAIVDLATGKTLGLLGGHLSAPTAVAVSADGARIATADRFGLIRLWDAKTFRPLNDAPGHRASVSYAELSPDGKRLLTHAEDETVRLWDLATGKELRAFGKATTRVHSYNHYPRFTPDGTAVVYNSFDRLIARDLQSGLEVPLPGELAKIRCAWVAFAPNGKSVLTWVGGRELEVWDWPSGKKRFAVEMDVRGDEPGFSPDGAVFADVTEPQRWSATTGKPLPAAWKKDESVSRTFGLRADLRPLVASFEGSDPPRVIVPGTSTPAPGARLVDYEFKEVDDLGLHPSWAVTFSPDRRQFALALSFFEIYEIRIYESATGKVRRVLPAPRPGGAHLLGFTPDGTKLLTAGGDHTVLVWDMRLQAMPLPDALKNETNAAKLWDALATGKAEAAYLAMARLSREPDAAFKLIKMKLKPAANGDAENDRTNLTDCRVIELLEALGTDESRALLKELAGGEAKAFRTQEAKRALERLGKK